MKYKHPNLKIGATIHNRFNYRSLGTVTSLFTAHSMKGGKWYDEVGNNHMTLIGVEPTWQEHKGMAVRRFNGNGRFSFPFSTLPFHMLVSYRLVNSIVGNRIISWRVNTFNISELFVNSVSSPTKIGSLSRLGRSVLNVDGDYTVTAAARISLSSGDATIIVNDFGSSEGGYTGWPPVGTNGTIYIGGNYITNSWDGWIGDIVILSGAPIFEEFAKYQNFWL
jgi:hypothetical protein